MSRNVNFRVLTQLVLVRFHFSLTRQTEQSRSNELKLLLNFCLGLAAAWWEPGSFWIQCPSESYLTGTTAMVHLINFFSQLLHFLKIRIYLYYVWYCWSWTIFGQCKYNAKYLDSWTVQAPPSCSMYMWLSFLLIVFFCSQFPWETIMSLGSFLVPV